MPHRKKWLPTLMSKDAPFKKTTLNKEHKIKEYTDIMLSNINKQGKLVKNGKKDKEEIKLYMSEYVPSSA